MVISQLQHTQFSAQLEFWQGWNIDIAQTRK